MPTKKAYFNSTYIEKFHALYFQKGCSESAATEHKHKSLDFGSKSSGRIEAYSFPGRN